MPNPNGDAAVAHKATPDDSVSTPQPDSGVSATPVSWSGNQVVPSDDSSYEVQIEYQGKPVRSSRCTRMGHSTSQCKLEKTYRPKGRVLKEPYPRGASCKDGSQLQNPKSKDQGTRILHCSNTFGALHDFVEDNPPMRCLDDSNRDGVEDKIVQTQPAPMSLDPLMQGLSDYHITEARNEDHLIGDQETKETGSLTKARHDPSLNMSMPLGRDHITMGSRNDNLSTTDVLEGAESSTSTLNKLDQA
ncbi:hypothetical protein Nepgr_001015 [Nepenthes gracilis]|uniref:Uncharacterized protein n=1 Tax=Nepenthes gracilis TaxID=150966 RepID=A0AAD3P468_NEPGR|nr:hypothetical protein Nepgr_001015 [Nepenthes gracilis]